ncbi:MAG TPA: hypothetical protein IAC48_07335 [Candidatus Limiplasma stercoravium]|nr:hypothetical protein [Candidatus Limiplasma stercoravium]
MGIGKRELMEDYYPDEIGEIIAAWNELHEPGGREARQAGRDPLAFFGGDGEWASGR